LKMLPNLRFLICGVLFCFLLFAVTGAGVMLPDTRTRVGEMPEIGRPMMQQSMMDASTQAQFYMTMVARRTNELERERAASAPAQPEPDLPKLEVIANPVLSEGKTGEDAEASVQVPNVESARDDVPPDPRVAALAPAPLESGEPVPIVPILGRIPLPPRRPALFSGLRHRVRMLRSRHRPTQLRDAAGQGGIAAPGAAATQTAPSANSPDALRPYPPP
jgi:hypothetical protein